MEAAPVLYPTAEEFGEFETYVRSIEPVVARFGIAVVRPPAGSAPARAAGYADLHSLRIRHPVRQVTEGAGGAYRVAHVELKPMSLAAYARDACGRFRASVLRDAERRRRRNGPLERPAADGPSSAGISPPRNEEPVRPPASPDAAPSSLCQTGLAADEDGDFRPWSLIAPSDRRRVLDVAADCPWASDVCSLERLERLFWRDLTTNPPTYGADLTGSLFDGEAESESAATDADTAPSGGAVRAAAVRPWNVARLKSLLSRHYSCNLPGITQAYLYFGMWRSFFSLHTEDQDLHSINYLHFGSPKIWYGVSYADYDRVCRAARLRFGNEFVDCPEFLRHKSAILTPALLRQAGVHVCRGVQREGDYIISMPGAYHFGFNSGFNCAESVNFATPTWIPIGLKAKRCLCVSHSVYLSMAQFDAPRSDVEVTEYDPDLEAREAASVASATARTIAAAATATSGRRSMAVASPRRVRRGDGDGDDDDDDDGFEYEIGGSDSDSDDDDFDVNDRDFVAGPDNDDEDDDDDDDGDGDGDCDDNDDEGESGEAFRLGGRRRASRRPRARPKTGRNAKAVPLLIRRPAASPDAGLERAAAAAAAVAAMRPISASASIDSPVSRSPQRSASGSAALASPSRPAVAARASLGIAPPAKRRKLSPLEALLKKRR